MPKLSKSQIDEDERKVMAELERNANENLDVLARRLKFSRQKVWRIIKRLDKDGSIWGYTAVVDDGRRTMNGYVLMLKRSGKPMDGKTLDAIASVKLRDGFETSVENMLYVHGEYDWVVTFTAPDIMEAKRFCDAFMAAYPGYFDRMSLMETLFTVRKHHVANPNQKKIKEFFA